MDSARIRQSVGTRVQIFKSLFMSETIQKTLEVSAQEDWHPARSEQNSTRRLFKSLTADGHSQTVGIIHHALISVFEHRHVSSSGYCTLRRLAAASAVWLEWECCSHDGHHDVESGTNT